MAHPERPELRNIF